MKIFCGTTRPSSIGFPSAARPPRDDQLDVFNVLDLLHDGWGLRRDALPNA
jgi:hypothetical protein